MFGEIGPKQRGTFQSGGMFLIQKITLISAQTTANFINIPQNFSHLKIIYLAQLSSGYSNSILTINNISSASSYFYQTLYGSNASVGAGENNSTAFQLGPDASVSNNAAYHEINFPGYTLTTFRKTIIELHGNDAPATTSYVQLHAGSCNTLNPINQITITAGGAVNFIIGSTFWLYGIY